MSHDVMSPSELEIEIEISTETETERGIMIESAERETYRHMKVNALVIETEAETEIALLI